MTRKHFVYAARIVASYHDRNRARMVAEAFVVLFREYNSRFDVTTFYMACGLTQ